MSHRFWDKALNQETYLQNPSTLYLILHPESFEVPLSLFLKRGEESSEGGELRYTE
jgi:hypothetical protein